MLYSVLYVCQQETPLEPEQIQELVEYYGDGVKLYGIFTRQEQIAALVDGLDTYLLGKNLCRVGEGLNDAREKATFTMDGDHFFMFHGSFYLTRETSTVEPFMIKNGDCGGWLPFLEKQTSSFDLPYFHGEHGNKEQNILVEGQSGTGKTRLLLSHFLFLWLTTPFQDETFLKSHKIIVFHDHLKQYYLNLLIDYLEMAFLVSNNKKYSRMLSAVHKIRFYRVYDLCLDEIRKVLFPKELRVVSDFSLLNRIIAQTTQLFLMENPMQLQKIQEWNLTFAEIEASLFSLAEKISRENLDISVLSPTAFGMVKKGDDFALLKEFYHESIFEIMKLWQETLLSQGEIHQSHVIPHFLSIDDGFYTTNKECLLIDDFNFCSKQELKALQKWAKGNKPILFMTQNPFTLVDRSHSDTIRDFLPDHLGELWYILKLQRQYRLDKYLYAKLLQSKSSMGVEIYGNFNQYLTEYPEKFYQGVSVYQKSQRISSIYEEIMRLKRRLDYEKSQGYVQANQKESFAILVEKTEDVLFITAELEQYGVQITHFHGDLNVIRDLKVLLRGILYFHQEAALLQLAESAFFGLKIDHSRLFTLQHKANDAVLEFLTEEIRERFAEIGGGSWEEFQEKLLQNPGYLRVFYDMTKPWLRYSNFTGQENLYKKNCVLLWEQIESEHLNSFSEVYEFIQGEGLVATGADHSNVYCMTYEECKGMEFGHVLLDLTAEALGEEAISISSSEPYKIAYEFSREQDNVLIRNEHSLENETIKNRSVALLEAMARCQYSFSWLYLEKEKDNWRSAFLRKGLERDGI